MPFVQNETVAQRMERHRNTAVIYTDCHVNVVAVVFQKLHFDVVLLALKLDSIAFLMRDLNKKLLPRLLRPTSDLSFQNRLPPLTVAGALPPARQFQA